jgi:hypothetical protein
VVQVKGRMHHPRASQPETTLPSLPLRQSTVDRHSLRWSPSFYSLSKYSACARRCSWCGTVVWQRALRAFSWAWEGLRGEGLSLLQGSSSPSRCTTAGAAGASGAGAKYMGSLSAPRSLSLFDGLLLSGSDDIHPVSAHDSMSTSLRAGAMSSRWSSTKIHLTWVH